MDESTLTALRGSIQHWENIRDGKEPAEHIGPRYCPLCRLFSFSMFGYCAGCPVRGKTGEDNCEDTPYEMYHRKVRLGFCGEADRVARAQAEVDFLKSLLPEEG